MLDITDEKRTIRQIAPKIKDVYAQEQRDVTAVKAQVSGLNAALSKVRVLGLGSRFQGKWLRVRPKCRACGGSQCCAL